MDIVFAILGIVIGAVIGVLLGRSKSAALEARLEMMDADNQRMRKDMADAIARMTAEKEAAVKGTKNELKAQFVAVMNAKDKANADALASQESRHREAISALQSQFNETMEKVTAQVKLATDDMLKERQKEFAESSNADLGQIVNPLRETIEKMKSAMDESTLKQTAMSSEMKANIENMMRQSEAARQSTDELARVFKHRSKVQGDWGEKVLDELLQSQGLKNGVHYDTQVVIRDANGNVVKTDDGQTMRPDVILHLDEQRELIIDSKVSLTAFMDYANAETEEDRQRYLKAHIDSLQKHVNELSAKDYSSYIRSPKIKMDYVIMFVPHTGALWTALNTKTDLWRKAMEKNVFIADEQTLYAALRIIDMTWTQIVQAQNHEKVFELANEMLDRVGQFCKKYEAVGKALDTAQKMYDDAQKKLSPQGQSIITTANKLLKLGAKESDKNPLPADIKTHQDTTQ